MQPGSAALIFAAPEVTRSADSEYPYRQSSDFWYFTGFNEPEAVLVLIKSNDTHNHSVIPRMRDDIAFLPRWISCVKAHVRICLHPPP